MIWRTGFRSTRARRTSLLALRDWLRSGVPPRPTPAAPAEALEAAAIQHGLGGLLAAAVSPDAGWIPEAVARLRRHRLARLALGSRQLETSRASVDSLGSAGFRALPLKGAAVADLVYDNPGDRPMADVDLLVLDDPPAAVRHLQAAGWTVGDVGDHAVALQGPQDHWLEIHHAWASCPSLHPLDRDGLWERRRAELPPARPSIEDLLLQAALHATFQHGLAVRLIQYVDIVRLAAHPDLDPARLAELAAAARCTDALALALAAAHELAGDVPLRLALPVRSDLSRLVAACATHPEAVLLESPRAIAWLRWALGRGRRAALLRDTLVPAHLGATGWARAGAVLRRTARLARNLGRD